MNEANVDLKRRMRRLYREGDVSCWTLHVWYGLDLDYVRRIVRGQGRLE